ncbi:MAG: hypothetical protein FWC16_13745 [Defluviitaleaceae bacterium]|nr:hypothetical protein [Defluviitaleaceae bacterium]MCL2275977.1 hypothetical protein [Defluviitaleaceae bacterium]
MPYNFETNSFYELDYTKLFHDINKISFMNNPIHQSAYIMKWICELKHYDELVRKQTDTPEKIRELTHKKLYHGELENFQLPIHFDSCSIFLHFRVSCVHQLFSYHPPKKDDKQHIDISLFTEPSNILWTPTDTNLINMDKINEPIIIIPFFMNKYNSLVIDGNHRLTYKINNESNDIFAYVLSEQSVIDFKLCASDFDLAFYIMLNEINHINSAIKNNEQLISIINKSFLAEGKYKFGH